MIHLRPLPTIMINKIILGLDLRLNKQQNVLFYEPTQMVLPSEDLNLLCFTCRDPSQAFAKHRDQQEKQQSDL